MATEDYNYDDFTSGSDDIATTSVTVLSGQDIAALVPIGQVTANGKFVECIPTANNGSEVAVYITAQPIDATAGDTKAQVFKAGTFDTESLAWNNAYTATTKLLAFVGTPISTQSKAAEL
jgi:hypothetical protein